MTGIDVAIKRLTDAFEKSLWPDVEKKKFYGRCFRNLRKGEVIPEVHIEGTNDYSEVLFDDKLSAMCFFDASQNVENISKVAIQEVRLIFAVNLKKVFPNIDYRATEEAHKSVIDVIKRTSSIAYKMDRIEGGLNAYGDLSTSKLKSYNMQPWYTFSIVMNVLHSYQCQI